MKAHRNFHPGDESRRADRQRGSSRIGSVDGGASRLEHYDLGSIDRPRGDQARVTAKDISGGYAGEGRSAGVLDEVVALGTKNSQRIGTCNRRIVADDRSVKVNGRGALSVPENSAAPVRRITAERHVVKNRIPARIDTAAIHDRGISGNRRISYRHYAGIEDTTAIRIDRLVTDYRGVYDVHGGRVVDDAAARAVLTIDSVVPDHRVRDVNRRPGRAVRPVPYPGAVSSKTRACIIRDRHVI